MRFLKFLSVVLTLGLFIAVGGDTCEYVLKDLSMTIISCTALICLAMPMERR
jgi:hypothetical protein